MYYIHTPKKVSNSARWITQKGPGFFTHVGGYHNALVDITMQWWIRQIQSLKDSIS